MTVTALFERLQATKGAPADLESFLAEANQDMQTRFGLAYIEIADQVHPDGEMALRAVDFGQTVKEFVDATAKDYYFAPVGDPRLKGGDAGNFNRAAVAICEFATLNPSEGWQRREAGVCYPMDDGFALMRPLKHKDADTFGFGIEVHQGGVLSANGFGVDNMGTLGDGYGSDDIESAIAEFVTDTHPKFRAI